MKIAIYGAGRIGTAFGFHLARAGHDITFIARGARLAELQQRPVVEHVNGDRAPAISALAALEPGVAYDFVLVTVMAHQVEPVLPALASSSAKKIVFMFNTVASLAPLREAVGATRFEMGFPTVTAMLVDGKLKGDLAGPGNITTVSSAPLVEVLKAAKIPAEVHSDMESFLRSHAAWVAPMMVLAHFAHTRGKGATWSEAARLAHSMKEMLGLVKRLGNTITPDLAKFLAWLPNFFLTMMLWAFSRTAPVRELGAMGPGEVRELIDGFEKLAPGQTPITQSLKP